MTASRGRLGAYARWQLRDYAFGPGVLTIVIAMLMLMPLAVGRNVALNEGASPVDLQRAFARLFDPVLAMVATVGPILGIANLASADRHPGLTRFLFAKPVSSRGYYLQAWIVRALALGVIAIAIAFAFSQFVAPVSMLRALAAVGMAWLLIGGVGFLLSVLVPRDGPIVLLAYLLPTLLSAMVDAGAKWWWLKPTLTIMPPIHKLDEFRQAMLGIRAAAPGDAWHMALFGAACVVAAAYLVRRLPLVR